MVRRFNELVAEFGSEYALRTKIAAGTVFRIGRGLYADSPDEGFLALAMARHHGAVVTLDSAFFYHGLTDVVPDALHLATSRSAKRIHDPSIRQHFLSNGLLPIGMTEMVRSGTRLRIYDLERLAIEAVRMKYRLPHELYKDVILSLRARASSLYPAKIDDYLVAFSRRDSILDTIEKEIF